TIIQTIIQHGNYKSVCKLNLIVSNPQRFRFNDCINNIKDDNKWSNALKIYNELIKKSYVKANIQCYI
ncbi:hypothetical protein ABPG74_006775, partial [Tetrahymena malaccensis]